jgi:periplasmic divalent cation tolerance protein
VKRFILRGFFMILVVLTTTPSVEEAERLAERIVTGKLAACVQVLPAMKSFYVWEGALQTDAEHLLLIKTLPEKYDELEKFIQSNHTYDVPEIVALPAQKVSADYFGWLNETLSEKTEDSR